MRTRHVIALVGAVFMLACGSAPKPTDALVNTQASLRAAREVGAGQVPDAQLHVKLAEEQVQRADKLMKDGDNEEAKRALDRAKADADLAVALAHHARAQQELENMQTTPTERSVSMTSAH
jgi:hypothetical protein